MINWTDQGVKNFKDSVDRYEAANAAMGESGARFTDVYWTIGQYDLVAIIDAPDDETATAALLAVGAPRAASGRRRCAASAPLR